MSRLGHALEFPRLEATASSIRGVTGLKVTPQSLPISEVVGHEPRGAIAAVAARSFGDPQ